MPENKVKKYFSLIEAWAWCEICTEMVNIRVDKDEIKAGLKMGIYTKEHKHINPHPDLDDDDDTSSQEHTVFIYINDNYDGSKNTYSSKGSATNERSIRHDIIR
ncbi:MAG: hypothetical protein ACTSQL_13200 [Promethearchaeota archaeon]